jgi:carboxymethylenebutenolidase
MARRLASHGYYVALPDLYHRAGTYQPFDGATVFTNADERARFMTLVHTVTPDRAAMDTETVMAHLDTAPEADPARMGVVGYCMGGRVAFMIAGRYGDRVRAAASYHGGNIVTDQPDSPHLLAPRVRARVYVGYADNDRGFTDAHRDTLEAALTSANVPHEISQYHALHGFTMADLPVYDEGEAERHWSTLLALLADTIGGTPRGGADR